MANGKKSVFYCELDFYSVPQVILITADNKMGAEESLNKHLKSYGGRIPQLKEINLLENNLIVIEPPGDRHMNY